MKYYDARIIEGCCVFSYTVEPPAHNEKNTKAPAKKSDEIRKNTSGGFWKKMLLQFFFLLLAPVALVIDAVWFGLKKLAAVCRRLALECARARELAACILVAISSTAIIPLVCLFL